jgi:hypothetical protein
MGNFQVCDALSILFELEKFPIEHLEGLIFYRELGIFCCEFPHFFASFAESWALNSLKEMVPGLLLNFLILLEELLTSMVYMGIEVTTCSEIYGDGVKAGVVVGVPH